MSSDLAADYISSAGERCGCCLLDDARAIGRVTGVPLDTGFRYSAPVCDACVTYLLASDWQGLASYVLAREQEAWTFWQRLWKRRRARRAAATIARCNAALFSNLARPNDAPRERSVDR